MYVSGRGSYTENRSHQHCEALLQVLFSSIAQHHTDCIHVFIYMHIFFRIMTLEFDPAMLRHLQTDIPASRLTTTRKDLGSSQPDCPISNDQLIKDKHSINPHLYAVVLESVIEGDMQRVYDYLRWHLPYDPPFHNNWRT